MSERSLVLEHPFASPDHAAAHFAHRLSVETDPSDVFADLQAGRKEFVLIDARSRTAFADAHLPGAVSLPHREIDTESTSIYPSQTLLVVYCWGPACNAGIKAAVRLAQLGFQVKEMIGGFEYWVREGFPIEGSSIANPDLYGQIAPEESQLPLGV